MLRGCTSARRAHLRSYATQEWLGARAHWIGIGHSTTFAQNRASREIAPANGRICVLGLWSPLECLAPAPRRLLPQRVGGRGCFSSKHVWDAFCFIKQTLVSNRMRLIHDQCQRQRRRRKTNRTCLTGQDKERRSTLNLRGLVAARLS